MSVTGILRVPRGIALAAIAVLAGAGMVTP